MPACKHGLFEGMGRRHAGRVRRFRRRWRVQAAPARASEVLRLFPLLDPFAAGLFLMVALTDIIGCLHKVGLRSGDRAMVHSSLSSFGHVEGGAETVIEALMTVVGRAGTLIMPTFTLSFLGRKAPRLNVVDTPSQTGMITEVFRRRRDAHRSAHITHSVAAWGQGAEAVASLPASTAWGPDSPFQWLLDHKAWILLLGVDFGICTLIHKAEETLRVPYRRMISFPGATTVFADGADRPNNTQVYYMRPHAQCDWSELVARIDQPPITAVAHVGKATVRLAVARAVYGTALEMIGQDPSALLVKGREES